MLLIVSVSIILCGSKPLYYGNFKHEKKGIDTLMLLTPYVYVDVSNNKESSRDHELEDVLTQQIYNDSYSLLKSKYQLAGFMLPSDSINKGELSNLFSILDASNKNSEVPVPLFIQNQIKNNSVRYFLFICYKGYYNAHYQPYDNLNVGHVGMAANGLYVNISKKQKFYSSDIKILVFDNQKNIIVYYDKNYSRDMDPRLSNLVEKMVLDILRPIYYK